MVSSSNMGGGVGMSSTPVRGATLARAIPLVTRQLSDADTSVCSMTSAQSNVNIVPRFSIAGEFFFGLFQLGGLKYMLRIVFFYSCHNMLIICAPFNF